MSFELKALKDICTIQIGKTPSRHENDYWRDGTHAWLSIADMNQGRYLNNTKECITDLGVRASNIRLIPKNTLVLSYKLSIGKVGITQKPMYTNEAIASLTELDSQVDINYLYWALQHIDLLENADRAAMGKTLNKAKLSEVKIPLPPLAEQRRIASILDQADELRQKRQQAIEKLDQLLQATFIDMFGDPNTYQNRFPIKSLKQVCTKITDGEHGTVERLESGKLYLMARNITKNMNLDITEVSYISEEDHQRIYKRCSPEFGDLMIVCVGATIGKLCLVPHMEEFSLARSVALLKPDNNSVISQYLLHLLASDYMQQKILNSRNTAAQAGLYLGKISVIEIPVPPKDLQEKWSKIALSIEDQKQNLYKQLDIQNQLFSALQNQVFNGTL